MSHTPATPEPGYAWQCPDCEVVKATREGAIIHMAEEHPRRVGMIKDIGPAKHTAIFLAAEPTRIPVSADVALGMLDEPLQPLREATVKAMETHALEREARIICVALTGGPMLTHPAMSDCECCVMVLEKLKKVQKDAMDACSGIAGEVASYYKPTTMGSNHEGARAVMVLIDNGVDCMSAKKSLEDAKGSADYITEDMVDRQDLLHHIATQMAHAAGQYPTNSKERKIMNVCSEMVRIFPLKGKVQL